MPVSNARLILFCETKRNETKRNILAKEKKCLLSRTATHEIIPRLIGHFTVMDGSEAEGDLVLIQTFFALLWKLFLKNNS